MVLDRQPREEHEYHCHDQETDTEYQDYPPGRTGSEKHHSGTAQEHCEAEMTNERDLRVGVPQAAESDPYHRADDRSKLGG